MDAAKELKIARDAIQSELSRIVRERTEKNEAITRNLEENQREITAAAIEMDAALSRDDETRYIAAAQRKTAAEGRIKYYESLRDKLQQRGIEFISEKDSITLWQRYTEALTHIYAEKKARQEELNQAILEESKQACAAFDEWYNIVQTWIPLVGTTGIEGSPANMSPPQKLAAPYRNFQMINRATKGVK